MCLKMSLLPLARPASPVLPLSPQQPGQSPSLSLSWQGAYTNFAVVPSQPTANSKLVVVVSSYLLLTFAFCRPFDCMTRSTLFSRSVLYGKWIHLWAIYDHKKADKMLIATKMR